MDSILYQSFLWGVGFIIVGCYAISDSLANTLFSCLLMPFGVKTRTLRDSAKRCSAFSLLIGGLLIAIGALLLIVGMSLWFGWIYI